MRNIYKIIVGMLIGGTLLMGIGSGVAFAEYSSFEYVGEKDITGTKKFTKEAEYKLPDDMLVRDDSLAEGKNVLFYDKYDCDCCEYEIQESEDVSKGYIKVRVHYNTYKQDCEPYLGETSSKYARDKECKVLEVDANTWSSDFDVMMREKDQILRSLKERKIITCRRTVPVEKVVIFVNPKDNIVLKEIRDFYEPYFNDSGEYTEDERPVEEINDESGEVDDEEINDESGDMDDEEINDESEDVDDNDESEDVDDNDESGDVDEEVRG